MGPITFRRDMFSLSLLLIFVLSVPAWSTTTVTPDDIFSVIGQNLFHTAASL